MKGRWLRRIAALDPVTHHAEIYRISAGYEFPWDYRRALELALFRTYCVPSISGLLDATREFADRPQQRYDDTALLMAEIAEHGYDQPRGRQAIGVINRMHGRYAIRNDDMRYVLSTFVYDPIDWINRYGWRRLHRNEELAAFHQFRAVGARMGIRDVPEDFADFRELKHEYERRSFRYADSNARVGRATLDMFSSWYPKPLRPAADAVARSLLDEPMLAAFGFAAPPAWVRTAADAALRARAGVVRLLPDRRTSQLTDLGRNRTYPGYPVGYLPTDLGAPPPRADLDPAWLRRPPKQTSTG